MQPMCNNCKWQVHGKYSALYGGCPIGCGYPIAKTKEEAQARWQNACSYEPKKGGLK